MSFQIRTLEPGQKITEPGLYANIPIETYHSGFLCDGPSASSSGLRTIFKESPLDYWVGSHLNPFRKKRVEAPHFVLGRATHHLSLGEDAFNELFVLRPEKIDGAAWQGNRTVCKQWLEDMANRGYTVLTPEQVEAVRGMVGIEEWQKGREDCGLANNIMVQNGILNGLIEHTLAWKDEETGIWLLSRPDAIPQDDTVEADLKTTQDVDHVSVERTIGDFRYDMQAANALVGMREVCGVELTNFALVFVKVKIPHTVRVVELRPDTIKAADADNRAALRTLRRCLDTDKWPGPEGRQSDSHYIGMTKWMREQADFRRQSLLKELEQ